MPRISVILPVYNAQNYLSDALQSVFAQTYQDFEVIAINDGSTDGSGMILDQSKDKRLRVIHQENKGLASTLNVGISHASGEFIARQDHDDISLPERFAKQIDYFDTHPKCGLLGTHAIVWQENIKTNRIIQHPIDNISLQLFGLFNCLFVHSSVMARTQTLIDAGLYPTDPERNPPEDFDLWLRVMKRCEVANLSEPLLIYKEIATGITQTKMNLLHERTHRIACEYLAVMLGCNDGQNYNDFIAAMRYDANQLSTKPSWDQCHEILNQLEASLLNRFAINATLINQNISQLKKRLQRVRLGHQMLGKASLVKAFEFIRKIKNRLKEILL